MSTTSQRPQSACTAARSLEYPHLEGIYLNAASYAPLPARSLAAIGAFQDRRAAGLLTVTDFADTLARARAACARLIGAAPESITLTPNTSVGINLAATFVRRRAVPLRNTVLLPDREFPANVFAWLALQRDGISVEITPVDEHGCPREDMLLERIARGDVVALAISAVQFATGHAADLVRLGRACAEAGTLFVVDAIQALGAVPIDVSAARIDVLACGGQKWLCGPFGTGFAYVRPELVAAHEPEQPGWLAFTSTADFSGLLDYEWDLWPDARRFEVGTLPIQGFLGLAHSIELILELGVEAIQRHIAALHAPLLQWASSEPGVEPVLPTPGASGILSLRSDDVDALHDALQAAGISCVPREGAIRFAPHFYNTLEEMEHVVTVLAAARA